MPMPESWCKRSAKAQAVGRESAVGQGTGGRPRHRRSAKAQAVGREGAVGRESAVGREGAKLRKLRISHPEHLSFASEADEQEERGCGNCRKGLFRTFFLSEQNL